MSDATIIQTLDELDQLSDSWDALSAGSRLPMHDYAWIRAAASTLAADGRLYIVVIGTPSHITAAAPLVRSRNDEASLELLGVGELYEPMDFLSATPSALAALTDALAGCKEYLALNRVPAQSGAIAALGRSYRGRGIVISQASRGSPWIPLDASWMQPEQQLSAGRRSDLRRARRTAETMGPLTFDVVRPTPGELGALLDEAFCVEAGSWKGRAGTALTRDSVRAPFYRRYAAGACRTGNLLVCFLRIGGRAAAMQIAVTRGESFWLLKIGFDDAFARCSPGTLLMHETVRYAASHGLQAYEFLGVDEPWTRMWTAHVRPYVSVRAYPASWHGLSGFATDVGRVARRTLGRAMQRTW